MVFFVGSVASSCGHRWWDYCGGNEQNCHFVSLQENSSSGEWHYKLLVHVTTEMNSFIPPTVHYFEIGVSYLTIYMYVAYLQHEAFSFMV